MERSGELAVAPVEIGRPPHSRIAVLDAGSQLTQTIARRHRALGVESIVLPYDTPLEYLVENFDAIHATGGPADVTQPESPKADPRIFTDENPLPSLFTCYAFQEFNYVRGGTVDSYERREDDVMTVHVVDPDCPVLGSMGEKQEVQMAHGQSVTKDGLAPGLQATSMTAVDGSGYVASFIDEAGTKFASQFHPEVTHTENGLAMLEQFDRVVAGMACDYVADEKIRVIGERVREQTPGDAKVVLGYSGGVDSLISGRVIANEIGSRLTAVHVNTGFNRKKESEEAVEAARDQGFEVHYIDASQQFQHARSYLHPVTGRRMRARQPLMNQYNHRIERAIFSYTYGRVFEQALHDLGVDPTNSVFAQGTLYPDLIESGRTSKKSSIIKLHHNAGGTQLAWKQAGRLLEPIADLFKDEVREVGEELGIPDRFVWRQPFPGPGLMVRIINGKRPPAIQDLAGVEAKLHVFGDDSTAVHLLPAKAVGLQGDEGTYKHMAVITSDGDVTPEHYDLAAEIPKLVHEVGRVVFMFGERLDPDRSIYEQFVPTNLHLDGGVRLLQEADARVTEASRPFGLARKITQQPVFLTGANPYGNGQLVILRPVQTDDFMTVSATRVGSDTYPREGAQAQIDAALDTPGIGSVAVELTGKPPGTTEAK